MLGFVVAENLLALDVFARLDDASLFDVVQKLIKRIRLGHHEVAASVCVGLVATLADWY